ncbi:MAG: cytosine permease, partial [Enterobacteriaceae bacterium]
FTFSFLWLIQTIIVSYGMEMIRKYEAIAGPIVLLTLIALAVWIFFKSGWRIASSHHTPLTGSKMWLTILAGGALWISIYGTFVLNFCDFTRSSVSKKSMVQGNFWGIPVNMLLFGIIVVVMVGGQFAIDGTIIKSPADIIYTLPNKFLVILASLALLVLTVAVNLMANFVAPVYALTNLFPRTLNFRKATFVSAVIGFIILPWNMYNSPLIIVYFLGGLGALLGPLFGIVMVDYWLIRKTKINVPQLFSEDPRGIYYYQRGINPTAVYVFIPSAIVSLAIALLPWFESAAPFTWFYGAILAALLYYARADKKGHYLDVSGECIAVDSKE